jgi:hypothetical protein
MHFQEDGWTPCQDNPSIMTSLTLQKSRNLSAVPTLSTPATAQTQQIDRVQVETSHTFAPVRDKGKRKEVSTIEPEETTKRRRLVSLDKGAVVTECTPWCAAYLLTYNTHPGGSDFFSTLKGLHFPENAQKIVWKDGTSTVLPWISAPGHENHVSTRFGRVSVAELSGIQDAEYVKMLASSSQNARVAVVDDRTPGQFVILPYKDASRPPHTLDQDIRQHLAHQRSIIVRGGPPLEGPSAFTQREIEASRGPLNQRAGWIGMIVSFFVRDNADILDRRSTSSGMRGVQLQD